MTRDLRQIFFALDDNEQVMACCMIAPRVDGDWEIYKLDEMENAIADKQIVIIGGHVNWQNKLKQTFPGWLFVHPDAYKTVNSGMLEGKEKAYFFTDYINHISYKKFVAIVREKIIPFGYIGSRNIESVVLQIYQEMVK